MSAAAPESVPPLTSMPPTARETQRPVSAATPGQADEQPLSLRAEVTQVARELRREADGIEADPYLNQHVRHADAEARRTAAARVEMAVTEDRSRPVPKVRDGIEQALQNLRRMGDGCAPSRAARVRAALDESARLIREAYDGSAIAAQEPHAAPASLAGLVDAHFFGDGPHPLQLVCLTENASDVECDTAIALVEPGATWADLDARIAAHAAECHAAAQPQPAPELAAATAVLRRVLSWFPLTGTRNEATATRAQLAHAHRDGGLTVPEELRRFL